MRPIWLHASHRAAPSAELSSTDRRRPQSSVLNACRNLRAGSSRQRSQGHASVVNPPNGRAPLSGPRLAPTLHRHAAELHVYPGQPLTSARISIFWAQGHTQIDVRYALKLCPIWSPLSDSNRRPSLYKFSSDKPLTCEDVDSTRSELRKSLSVDLITTRHFSASYVPNPCSAADFRRLLFPAAGVAPVELTTGPLVLRRYRWPCHIGPSGDSLQPLRSPLRPAGTRARPAVAPAGPMQGGAIAEGRA